MFLEPETGLAWYDPGRKNLELVIGVQSPHEAAESAAFLLGNAQAGYKPAHINTQCAYVGGGFGGRDPTPFPLYPALAAVVFLGPRAVSPTIGTSNSNRGSSGTVSRSTRGWGSIGPPAKSSRSRPIMCCTP